MDTKVIKINSKRQKRTEKYTEIAEVLKKAGYPTCTPKQVRNRAQGKSGSSNRKVTNMGECIDIALVLYDDGKDKMLTGLVNRLKTSFQ